MVFTFTAHTITSSNTHSKAGMAPKAATVATAARAA